MSFRVGWGKDFTGASQMPDGKTWRRFCLRDKVG